MAWVGRFEPDDRIDDDLVELVKDGGGRIEWRKIHGQPCEHLSRCQILDDWTAESIVIYVEGEFRKYRLVFRGADGNFFFAKNDEWFSVVAFKMLSSVVVHANFDVGSAMWRDVEITLTSLAGTRMLSTLVSWDDNMYRAKWHLLSCLEKKMNLTGPEVAETKIFLQDSEDLWPITGQLCDTLAKLGLIQQRPSPVARPVLRRKLLGGFARRSFLKDAKK